MPSSRVRFQIIRVLSRLPERSILGFSREVANEVTQPLWPSSMPVNSVQHPLIFYWVLILLYRALLIVPPCLQKLDSVFTLSSLEKEVEERW